MNAEGDISLIIKDTSDEEIVARFGELLSKMEEANRNRMAFPELEIFRLFGLYKADKPAESWLHRIATEPEIARDILGTICERGTFPEELANVAWQRAQYHILRKQRKSARTQSMWRGVKIFTKGVALLGLSGEESAGNDYILNIILTYGLWGLIDRATADPEERRVASAVALGQSLQRAFKPPDERNNPDPDTITKLALGWSEPDQQTLTVIESWQKLINELLDSGVMPQAIFKVLKRRWLHIPARLTVDSAEKAIMDGIQVNLDKLQPEGGQGNKWDSQEAVEQRKKERQELANMALQKTPPAAGFLGSI